jgi:hypothetical protein
MKKKMKADGTYSKAVLSASSSDKIGKILDMLNIPNQVSCHSLHTTIVYSRSVCDEIRNIPIILPIKATPKRFDLFDSGGNTTCLVLILESEGLDFLHHHSREFYSATHDFPEYHPHITLSYDYPFSMPLSEDIISYIGELEFDQYIVEPLIFDWVEPK